MRVPATTQLLRDTNGGPAQLWVLGVSMAIVDLTRRNLKEFHGAEEAGQQVSSVLIRTKAIGALLFA